MMEFLGNVLIVLMGGAWAAVMLCFAAALVKLTLDLLRE
jgi:hypothetical protein